MPQYNPWQSTNKDMLTSVDSIPSTNNQVADSFTASKKLLADGWIDMLISGLGSSSQFVRDMCRNLLILSGESAVGPLSEVLRDIDNSVSKRQDAAWVLGQIGTPEARQALTEALDDSNPDIRASAATAVIESYRGPILAQLREIVGTQGMEELIWNNFINGNQGSNPLSSDDVKAIVEKIEQTLGCPISTADQTLVAQLLAGEALKRHISTVASQFPQADFSSAAVIIEGGTASSDIARAYAELNNILKNQCGVELYAPNAVNINELHEGLNRIDTSSIAVGESLTVGGWTVIKTESGWLMPTPTPQQAELFYALTGNGILCYGNYAYEVVNLATYNQLIANSAGK